MVKILKKSDSTHSSSKGAVNAYFLTGSFFKQTVVFEAAIFVGQPEDGVEVRCEVSRRVETAVSLESLEIQRAVRIAFHSVPSP